MNTPSREDAGNDIFNHSKVDEYGFTMPEFRLLFHLARRDGGDGAYASAESMARICRMHRDTVFECLGRLKALNVIRAVKQSGYPTRYFKNPRRMWKPYTDRVSEKKGCPSISDTPCRKPRDIQVSESKGHEGDPREGNPMKDNTVARPVDPIPTLPASTVVPSQEPCPPGGRFVPPRRDKPAVFRYYRQSGTGNADEGNGQPPCHPAEKQSAIRRKAYAVAERLQWLHWDNCKVRFVKETARSYAEGALEDGHDETIIVFDYKKALCYCHGFATDEICRGERCQLEKASPALTVWLARECLKGDPRTVEERWKAIIAKLTAEKRKVIEEEAKLCQEIIEKEPEIKAWFANRLNRPTSTDAQVPLLEMKREHIAA